MNEKTSTSAQATMSAHSFYSTIYAESPPKRSRLHESSNIRPPFKSFNDKLTKFDVELSVPPKGPELREPEQQEAGEEPKSLDRDSPIPLKNLGNTCYENSIIQCLFSLNMFMDNFERSMKRMRRLVVKSKSIKTCTLDGSAEDRAGEHQKQAQQTLATLDASGSSISENDVRYRIADAFDKLYRSYTQKRIQIESSNSKHSFQTSSSTGKTTTASTNHHDEKSSSESTKASTDDDDNQTSFRLHDFAISKYSAAIPLCKSPKAGTSSEDQTTSSDENQTTTNDSSMTSNLTPIALVSSTSAPNEQSEIETRLEDLKSAVGERSSQFNSTHQQDASEFFYHVIDSIQEFYQSLDRIKVEDNPVTKAFELELDYLIRCPKCHHRVITDSEKVRTLPLALPHVTEEASKNQVDYHQEANGAPTPPTSDLGLDSPKSNASEEPRSGSDEKENQALVEQSAPEDNSNNTMSIAKLELSDKSENNSQSQSKHYTLRDALNNFFKDDLLDYSCSQPDCNSKQRTKKCLIRKLPQVLFITLARYSYTGKKSLDEIEAPFELSVPFRENKSPSHSPSAHWDFDDDGNTYQLIAVVCHLGPSLNAGHYTSYVYNQNNFSWYSCDDDSITKVQESDVKADASKSGYCFFYAHKSCMNSKQPSKGRQVEQVQEKFNGTDTILVSSSAVESSVVLTPESSPKSSPTPSVISQDEIAMHEDHTECMNGTTDIDDWS